MVVGGLLVALGGTLTVAAAVMAIGASSSGPLELRLFGFQLMAGQARGVLLTVFLLTAGGVALLAAGLFLIRRRIARRRMRRITDLSVREAGLQARIHLLEPRAEELIEQLERLEALYGQLAADAAPEPPAEVVSQDGAELRHRLVDAKRGKRGLYVVPNIDEAAPAVRS